MKNRRGILALIVILSLLALACNAMGGGGDATPDPTSVPPTKTEPTAVPTEAPTNTPEATKAPEPTATPQPTATKAPVEPPADGASIEIINQSDQEIWYVYISPSDADDWGEDLLESTTIPVGESYTLTGIPEGTYDLLAENIDEVEIETLWGAEVTGENTWTVTATGGGGAASLEVFNDSEDIIVELYVSPSSSDSWGDDWLGGSVIKSGESFMVEGLAVDTYDVQVVNADGDAIETIYNYYIDGEYYWNVTGKADLPNNAVLRFEDDFSDNHNNWAQTPESDDVHYQTPENGEYCILIKSTNLTAWEWYEPFRTDEFVAEVACVPDSETDASCGLGFGPDGDNLYWFEVSPSDQTFALFVLKDDAWQDPLIDWTDSKNIIPSGWNYLSLERVNDVVSVFVNGVQVGQVDSTLFPTGRIGIGGSTYNDGNVTVCLDDLRVWRIE